MRVLLTGGSSLLGKALIESKPESVELTPTWFTNYQGGNMLQLDIYNTTQVAYIFERAKPEVVIHTAAVGSVDYTEGHFHETHRVNVVGTRNLIQAGPSKFVYISTNAIFSGNNPPYSEQDDYSPINRYGSLKREAEILVKGTLHWLIIRPFLLYGWPYPNGRPNWATIIKQKLEQGQRIKLVDDVYWQPTLVLDVAHTIWALLEAGKENEIYHVASDERMTLYRFGQLVAKNWNLDIDKVEPVGSDSFKHLAPRPVDTTYNLDKIHSLGFKLRNPKEGLKVMK